jgi:hypothetical protein
MTRNNLLQVISQKGGHCMQSYNFTEKSRENLERWLETTELIKKGNLTIEY